MSLLPHRLHMTIFRPRNRVSKEAWDRLRYAIASDDHRFDYDTYPQIVITYARKLLSIECDHSIDTFEKVRQANILRDFIRHQDRGTFGLRR